MGHVLNLETIIKVSNDLRKNGKKVIFTHGTFDLFHAGHAFFLEKCKREGDVLIVGVDGDNRIKARKINRPIIELKQRLLILEIANVIDYIFVVDEYSEDFGSTYEEIYTKLIPDVVIFGRDHKVLKDLPALTKLFPKIQFKVIEDMPDGKPSTTAIIQKIAQSQSQN